MAERHSWAELFKNNPTWQDIIDDRNRKKKQYKALFTGGVLNGKTIPLHELDEMGYITSVWSNTKDYRTSFPIIEGYKAPILLSDSEIIYHEGIAEELQELDQEDIVQHIQDENGQTRKVLYKFIK